ncbi:uncharacterized protein [Euwallacea fornicatus]|uniref:uncharacterized protein n=1 Tax=Euwallacea fornicatus TaxID=995702 RepID=UPI00338EE6EC
MKIMEIQIKQIEHIVQETVNRGNLYFIKDVLIQIINLYEIIDSMLQDIETSIAFARLGNFHPSIMRTTDLFSELKTLEVKLPPNSLPLSITLENTLEYEKIISVESFILKGKITYLLKVPITDPSNFDYYHLYSVPIGRQSQFKAVIPRGKYLLMNQSHYTYPEEPCKRMTPKLFICNPGTLEEINADSPCEVGLLSPPEPSTHCPQINVTITRVITNQLDSSNKWILIFPTDKTIKLKCGRQEEYRKIAGSFLATIPEGCQIEGNQVMVSNENSLTSADEPIMFPNLDDQSPNSLHLNLTLQLQEVKLDELHELKHEIQGNQPQLEYTKISTFPSLGTIIIYVLIFISIGYIVLKKLKGRQRQPGPEEEAVNPCLNLPHSQGSSI